MGENEIIHLSDLLIPQKGSKDVLADIETVLVRTAAINQHPFPFWKFDKDRIPLAHIEKGEGKVFFKTVSKVPVGKVKDKNETETQ